MHFRNLFAVLCLIAAGALTVAVARPPVIFVSPCVCEGNHGVMRWAEKTDLTQPPSNPAEIHAVTPAEMFTWPRVDFVGNRTGRETQWFAVTGRLIQAKAENDGDIHLVIEDLIGTDRNCPRNPLGRQMVPAT